MTYESANLAEIENKLRQSTELLNEIKNNLSNEKIKEALKNNFEDLKQSLEEELKSSFLNEQNKLKNDMQELSKKSFDEFYNQNKDEFYSNLGGKVDFSLLFEKNKNKLEFFNKEALKEALKEEFKQEKYTTILQNLKNEANENLEIFQKDLNELLKKLNVFEISENLLKKEFKKDFENLSKEELEKQKAKLAKEFLEHFLSNASAKELLEQNLKEVLETSFSQRKLKDTSEALLLKMNKKLLEQILATKKLKNYDFKQSLVLTSMSLKTELSIVNDNLAILNDLEAKELRAKLLSEGLEQKEALMQRRYKVV